MQENFLNSSILLLSILEKNTSNNINLSRMFDEEEEEEEKKISSVNNIVNVVPSCDVIIIFCSLSTT